jgi:hypothetical protein
MAKGVPHYFKDGTEHKGGTHKMPDGFCIPVKFTVKQVSACTTLKTFLKQHRKKQVVKSSGAQEISKVSPCVD